MKKRILGLALALIMIISLLPMTTFAAAAAKVKIVFYQPSRNCEFEMADATPVQYIVLEDDASTPDTTDKKPVQKTSKPADNYVMTDYSVDAVTGKGTYTLTLHNFDTTAVKQGNQSKSAFFTINTNAEYDVVIQLEGTNVISGPYDLFAISNTGDVTITGDGSLQMSSTGLNSSSLFLKSKPGNLYIKNTTITIPSVSGPSGMNSAFVSNGSIFIENSTVEAAGIASGVFLRTAPHATNNLMAAADAEIQITSSTVKAQLAYSNNNAVLNTNGKITIKNSNVIFEAGHAKNSRIASTVPYLEGNYTAKTGELGFGHKDYKSDLTAFNLTAGEDIAQGTVRYLEVKHECVAANPDTDCTTPDLCACGKVAVEAKQHIAGANADDCTEDTLCGNDGCTQVYAPATHPEHTPGQDDGNCLTPVKCANPGCQQNAVAAAENHTGGTATCTAKAKCDKCGSEYGEMLPHSGGTATCTAKAKCVVCSQEYGELAAHTPKDGEYACNENHPCANPDCDEPYRPAGTHVGGGTEATCEKKAVCKCGEEYGELAACKPAADDGDCTTAIKCSVCGKEITAGQDAHKYTDKKDTTCDNEGCENTRKVEEGATENPKTGDNAVLVLALSLMAASAAAFVCTKKFAR